MSAMREPDRRVEGRLLVNEQVRELGFESLGRFRVREVAAELLAGFPNRMGDSVDELTNAPLAFALVTIDPGLAEVLGNRDVGRELAPPFGNLGPLELEHHGAVGVGNLTVA